MAEFDAERDEVFRSYALEYFKVHAEQRLKAFNFYLLLQTALLAVFATLAKDGQLPKWGAAIAPLGVLFSFVFWKLDDRTRDLIRISEAALKELDTRWNLPSNADGGPSALALFAREEFQSQPKSGWNPLSTLKLSYTRSFNFVFILFSCLHALAFVACLAFGR